MAPDGAQSSCEKRQTGEKCRWTQFWIDTGLGKCLGRERWGHSKWQNIFYPNAGNALC